MSRHIGLPVRVQTDEGGQPVRFTWRGERHEVVEVVRQRVDATFGDLPPRSRKWFTRRHRRCYVVKDDRGDVYEMYLDYSNRKEVTWRLVRKIVDG